MMMQQDSLALEQAIAVGHGEVLQDLATLFEIAPKNYNAFAKMLRSQNKDLQNTMADPGAREEAAERFMTIVEIGMAADTALHAEYLEIALM